MVVVGANLDRDFFERRDLLIAGGPENAHVRWTIVHHADEVLGLARRAETVRIDERDAVRIVPGENEAAFEHAVG